jgi:hypothetical protein
MDSAADSGILYSISCGFGIFVISTEVMDLSSDSEETAQPSGSRYLLRGPCELTEDSSVLRRISLVVSDAMGRPDDGRSSGFMVHRPMTTISHPSAAKQQNALVAIRGVTIHLLSLAFWITAAEDVNRDSVWQLTVLSAHPAQIDRYDPHGIRCRARATHIYGSVCVGPPSRLDYSVRGVGVRQHCGNSSEEHRVFGSRG